MAARQIRHGDVLVTRVADYMAAADGKKPRMGRAVLAEGEITGHAHVATGRGLRLAGDRLFVPEPAELTHEEHGLAVLEPGEYIISRQMEFVTVQDTAETRYVRD
jgi:hypothetical protein